MVAFSHKEFEEHPEEKTEHCFFCHELLKGSELDTGGVVFWHGSNASIALHQPCAESFAIHLIQDSAKLQIITKKFSKLIPSEVRTKI
ncbi:hypothetical protein EHQ26_03285 [Leptospira bourretii]|uniref:Uncharacterized protein n=1 Tax=Leptospira bourretii TaxID=2484962 RepID=A0ABY2LKK3_9LEPT|nr:hypothetical protein EHQ26_03285 [Leptospira bourretii]TGL38879.1 hypothetical protein EHQ45_04745 [Leptospira bourretii]